MNILKTNSNNSKKISVSFIAVAMLLNLVIFSIIFTIPVSACHTVGTFESDYKTPKTTFMIGETVYGVGEDIVKANYKLRIFNPSGDIVFISDPIYDFKIKCAYLLNDTAPIGEWEIQFGQFIKGSWHWDWMSFFNVTGEQKYDLTMTINGLGTVIKDPDLTSYSKGTLVQLTATNNPGWTFSHWSGNINSHKNPVNINMTDDKYITAHFTKKISNGGYSNIGDIDNGGEKINDVSEKNPTKNLPPTAILSAIKPYKGFVNTEITFNGSLSFDPDGFITSWNWNFGDGDYGEGINAIHKYSLEGEYIVTLSVTDNNGVKNTSTPLSIVIHSNRPPSDPEINGSTTTKKGEKNTYTVFSTDDNNDSIKYTIDWGDGIINESEFLPNGELFKITHKWEKSGSYTIRATANDNHAVSISKLKIIIEEPLIEEDNIILIYLALISIIILILSYIIYRKNKNK